MGRVECGYKIEKVVAAVELMVYSAWKSEGFGVCGAKNVYGKKVKIGNYVDDLETDVIEHKCDYKTEQRSEFAEAGKGIGKKSEEEELAALESKYGMKTVGMPYDILFKANNHVDDYKTSHNQNFGPRTQPPKREQLENHVPVVNHAINAKFTKSFLPGKYTCRK